MTQGPLQRGTFILCLMLAVLFSVVPILHLIFSSLKPEIEILSQSPRLLPVRWYFSNYRDLFELTPILQGATNSVITACLVTVLTVLCSSYTAYMLTRVKTRSLDWASKVLLFCYALPDVIVAIGFYLVFAKLKALNSYFSLALAQSATTIPFGIWML
ncbi:MAG TPA: hypothetical protein VK629_16740, partial [Steroidobacteraceae bacterium]|nr:hypothetical protein [Steroidobacteraceae bacterium]